MQVVPATPMPSAPSPFGLPLSSGSVSSLLPDGNAEAKKSDFKNLDSFKTAMSLESLKFIK